MPAEVLELPQKGDRIIHFAWEPHVRLLLCWSFASVSLYNSSIVPLQPMKRAAHMVCDSHKHD